MDRVTVPVLHVYPILPAVKIQLVHSEGDQDIFRLPRFLVRIAVGHAHAFHHVSACRVLYIMCRRYVWNSGFSDFLQHRKGSFCHNALMLAVPSQGIAEIMAFPRVHVDIANGDIICLKTYGIMEAVRFLTAAQITFFKELLRFRSCL